MGNNEEAKACFEQIATKYAASYEAREVEKYINAL
jgi:hypothetical protein